MQPVTVNGRQVSAGPPLSCKRSCKQPGKQHHFRLPPRFPLAPPPAPFFLTPWLLSALRCLILCSFRTCTAPTF
jgi:hypothetical protein